MVSAVCRPARPRVRTRSGAWPLAWAVAALTGVFLASFLVGRYPVAPHMVLGILASKLLPATPSWVPSWPAFWPAEAETVVLRIRLPRILAAMMVGAALSGSGAAYQGVFRNPMVAPDILGVAAGAGFGAALAILLGWEGTAIQAAAFAGGLAAVAATCAVGAWRDRPSDRALTMVLAGIVVGAVFSSGIALVKFVADPNNALPAITFWLMGSLAALGMRDLALAAGPALTGLAVLLLLRWRLNILSFGDEEARALGVDAARTRLAVVVAATLATAASVAVAGVVGLVGLIVPHLARRLVGANHSVLLPTSTLLGAAFLLAVDDLARGLVAGEIPLGILTSLIGAPFLAALVAGFRAGAAP